MIRTITDPSELDALPPWAAVEDVLGVAWVRHPGTPDRADHWVSYYGDRMSAQYVTAEGPLTVLHDPSASVALAVSDTAVEAVARCPWADCPHGERCAHAQGPAAVPDATVETGTVEVYPFHARIDDMPDLFHVKCSQHPEFGFCGSEAEAAQARVEHLSTHEGSAVLAHICTVHCEQGRGHYEVMTAAPVVPDAAAAPSATRDEVAQWALAASSVTITDSPYQKAEWLHIADALLARFTITSKESP